MPAASALLPTLGPGPQDSLSRVISPRSCGFLPARDVPAGDRPPLVPTHEFTRSDTWLPLSNSAKPQWPIGDRLVPHRSRPHCRRRGSARSRRHAASPFTHTGHRLRPARMLARFEANLRGTSGVRGDVRQCPFVNAGFAAAISMGMMFHLARGGRRRPSPACRVSSSRAHRSTAAAEAGTGVLQSA